MKQEKLLEKITKKALNVIKNKDADIIAVSPACYIGAVYFGGKAVETLGKGDLINGICWAAFTSLSAIAAYRTGKLTYNALKG